MIPGTVIDNSDRDLQELEALFAGARLDPESPVGQLYERPSVPIFGRVNPLDEIYNPPFAEFLKNDSLFGGFLNQSFDLVPPFINLTWREMYFGSFTQENVSKPHFH